MREVPQRLASPSEETPKKKKKKKKARLPRNYLVDFDFSRIELPYHYPRAGILVKKDNVKDLELLLPYLSPKARSG